MEFADVKSFADMLLDACEAAENAGKPMLDTCLPHDRAKRRRQDMTRIAKDLSKILHLDSLALPEIVEQQLPSLLPWLSPSLDELATWFEALCDKTEKTHRDRIRDRFYTLLFYLIKNLCDHYACDGLQTFCNMISRPGNLDQGRVKRHLRTYIENGEKYRLLSNDLGGPGILFLLPEKGDSYWLTKVPKGTTLRGKETRNSVITSLIHVGITTKATELNAHTVATNALQHSLGVCKQALSYPRQHPASLDLSFYFPCTDLSQVSPGDMSQGFVAPSLHDERPDAMYPQKRRCTGEGITSGLVDPFGISIEETVSLPLVPRVDTESRPRKQVARNSVQPRYSYTTNQSKAPIAKPDTGTCLYNSNLNSETVIPMQDPDNNMPNALRSSVYYPTSSMLHETTSESTDRPFPPNLNDTSMALQQLCSGPPLFFNNTHTGTGLNSEPEIYLNDTSTALQELGLQSQQYVNDTSIGLQGLASGSLLDCNVTSMGLQEIASRPQPYLNDTSSALQELSTEPELPLNTSMGLQELATVPQIYPNDTSMALQHAGMETLHPGNTYRGMKGVASKPFYWTDTSMSLHGVASETQLDPDQVTHAAATESYYLNNTG